MSLWPFDSLYLLPGKIVGFWKRVVESKCSVQLFSPQINTLTNFWPFKQYVLIWRGVKSSLSRLWLEGMAVLKLTGFSSCDCNNETWVWMEHAEAFTLHASWKLASSDKFLYQIYVSMEKIGPPFCETRLSSSWFSWQRFRLRLS